jgi:hypothetical protein
MALTKQTSSKVFSLASQVLSDRNASAEAKLLAATVLAHAPLPSAKRERSQTGLPDAKKPVTSAAAA